MSASIPKPENCGKYPGKIPKTHSVEVVVSVPELANNLCQGNKFSYSPTRPELQGLLYRKCTIVPGTYRDSPVLALANNLSQDDMVS